MRTCVIFLWIFFGILTLMEIVRHLREKPRWRD